MIAMNEDLLAFVTAARWYGGKGRSASVSAHRRLGWLTAVDAEPAVAVDVVELTYDDGGEPELYQLPLALYSEQQERLNHAFVGLVEDPDAGSRHAYDAPHDRQAMQTYLRHFAEAEVPADPSADSGVVEVGHLEFHRLTGHRLDVDTHSTLFSGEQSNSSVMFGEDAVLKVFRRLTPGVNPDVAVHEALTTAGSTHVAHLFGWLQTSSDGDMLQLAVLQQFLRTAADGWDLAQASVRNLFGEADLHASEVGGDFAAEAARLGIALREVHEDLRAAFESDVPDVDLTTVTSAMAERLDAALPVVDGLDELAPGIRDIFEDAAGVGRYPVQRVHGDLHLGQTLRTVLGWKIVDFEGEPAKPLSERSRPDIRWRDVAGMLRSFDYAARASLATSADPDDERYGQLAYRAQEWARRNQQAFLAAYTDGAATDAERALLRAYVADKAVYEAVYEIRNRPTWVGIPLAAIAALIASDPDATTEETT